MANNLGSMILELGANVARFESDMGKAARIAQLNAEKMQKTVQGAIDGISGGLKSIAGTLVAAFSVERLVEFGRSAIDTADNVGKMAQKVGLSAEALSAYQVQARLSDVANDQLQGGLSKLARAAAEAASGSKQQAAAFQSIGVSVKDASGNLRPMGELVQDVAKKFSGYADSASKTALAQQFFGKSGADLIPFLNELGQKSLPEVTKQAEQFGAVISGDTAKAAEHFNDNLTSLGLEAQGFANSVVSKLLPSLSALTDQMVDAGKTTDNYASSANTVANAVKFMALALLSAKEVVSGFASATFAVFDAVSTVFNASGQVVQAWAETTAKAIKAAFSLDKAGLDAADAEFAARFAKIGKDVSTALQGAFEGGSGGVRDAIQNAKKDYDALFGAVQNVGNAAADTSKKLKDAPIPPNPAALEQGTKDLLEMTSAMESLDKIVTTLQGKSSDPYGQAAAKYANDLLALQQAAEKAAIAGNNVDEVIRKWQAGETAAALALEKTNAQIREQSDLLGKVQRDFADQTALLGLSEREKEIATAVQQVTREYKANVDAGRPVLQTLQELQEGAAQAAASFYDQKTAIDLSTEAAKQWQSIWSQAGNAVADTFAKVLVEGGSLFSGLKDLAKQTVEQIIAYFARLAVINPILNAVFGGFSGFSLLPSLANAGGLGGGVGGGASLLTSDGSGGGTFSLLVAGKTIWDGFKSGLTSFWSGSNPIPASAQLGNGGIFGNQAPGGFQYGGFGQALGVAGGIYAGYNRFKQGGALGGLAGGAAYGLGTYALGAGLTSAVAGTGFAAGVGGAFAVPVVGWVALAAMLIDKFSGGKLFGTGANKFQGGTQTETITDAGGNVTAIGTFKGQKSFFRGSYYKDKPLDVSDDAVKAAQDFAAALKKATEDFANSLHAQIVPIVSGVFKTTFDSKGNVTGTESTVLGVTRKETEEQFDKRLQADSFLAVLDKMGLAASEFVKGLQDDADALFSAVQDFATVVTAANTDLANGFTFLALSANATLVDIVKFAEANQKAGETLTQTFARLEQAQAQYNQFVAQFTPGTAYVDDFEAAFSQVYHSMLQNIDTANELAKAAGAAGASQEDLTNIQNAAAQQMAALVLQLEQSAQSLAFSLGVSNFGSLDQVNDEISRIIGVAKDAADATQTTTDALSTATDSVTSFGSAVSRVAKTASDSVNLLLGNLSPLNDQQKLQVALQGLRAGTVTKEQVLQIGRNLYASSQAYTDLFNSVARFPARSGGDVTSGRGFGQFASHSASQTVTPAPGTVAPKDFTGTAEQFAATGLTEAQWNKLSDKDKQKLEDLLNEQTTLKAAKSTQDFQTLARQIAEIASAKGETFQQVLQEMGIKQADIEKGLGLATDQALADYADNLQKQIDSAGENTKSIVDAIALLPRQIFDAFNGSSGKPVGGTAYPLHPITMPAPTPNPAPAPPPSGGGSGGGTGGGVGGPIGRFPGQPRMTTDADAEAFGQAAARYLGPYIKSATGRSNRAFVQ